MNERGRVARVGGGVVITKAPMPVSANLASPQLAADFFERQYRRVHFGEIQSTPGAGRSATTFA
jgi:hypothetical protein